jgi:diadenylate cyclase
MNSDTCELLLVDDRTDLITLLYSQLARRKGFRVERLQTSGEAVSRLSAHRYDLILSNDVTQDGKKLRRLAALQGIPLVQVKNERNSSRKSHFTLLPEDVIVLEDDDQRVEFPVPDAQSIREVLRRIAQSFEQMARPNQEMDQFQASYGSPYEVLLAAPMPMGIVREGVVAWANEELAHALGYSRSTLQGTRLSSHFSDPAEYRRFRAGGGHERKRPGWSRDVVLLARRDGRPVPFRLKKCDVQRETNEAACILIAEDLSRELQAEEMIREYEERMTAQEIRHQQVLQSMGALVVRTDTDGTIAWLNSQAEALFGLTALEAEGKPFVGTLVSPEDASARDLAAMISDCSCHPEEYEIRAIFHRTGAGHEVCVAWKIVGIMGAEGKTAGVLCVGEDITDYRETEARGIRTDPWKSRLLAGTDICEEVFDAVFHIAIEISREGREGRKVGTSFVLGDAGKVLERSRQLTLNSFAGQGRALRTVTDPQNKECIKNFAQLDGAFVVTGDGLIEAAGRQFLVGEVTVAIPPGYGTRHTSVAAMTAISRSVGIVVSETAGRLTVFRGGKIVKTLLF